ncbi:MAG: hypothetical protein GXY48_12935 [Methanomicrobiales archaeon]|nr:hypothetical protein [Methanomicrobiales archaeon]
MNAGIPRLAIDLLALPVKSKPELFCEDFFDPVMIIYSLHIAELLTSPLIHDRIAMCWYDSEKS